MLKTLVGIAAVCVMLARPVPTDPGTPADVPFHAILIGGGPDVRHNQVAIESNMRYIVRLLPAGCAVTALFADGNPQNATVLYDPDPRKAPRAERILGLLTRGLEADSKPSEVRPPDIGRSIDGPSNLAAVRSAFAGVVDDARAHPGRPLLLYFTGHGSQNARNLDDNDYDLWGSSANLSVHELAADIGGLPASTPVTIVMVQCFSGAFGNLIFDRGDPSLRPGSRDIAGFFATIRERVAAGCTSAVNQAEYRDFTSYFFAALTGRDRLGRSVSGADYNRDGRVGLDEAFCWALVHDDSIDIPVCTSDVFLRRWSHEPDATTFRTSWRDVRAWATPAQRAALDGMSSRLRLSGDDRMATAYAALQQADQSGSSDTSSAPEDSFAAERATDRREVGARWPSLRTGQGDAPDRQAALSWLRSVDGERRWRDLLAAADTAEAAQARDEAGEIRVSYLLRFARLGKSVILAHQLRTSGDANTLATFERLIRHEQSSPLPPAPPFSVAVSAPSSRGGAAR